MTLTPRGLEREAAALRDLADNLGRSWAAVAETRTTIGRERGVLRLFGVDGLDRDGRPLAAEVADRFVLDDSDRLAAGIALPFAVALLEYDITPQRLALDVASGAVDLRLESELLARPERRSAAAAEVKRLIGLALDRFDANRVARSELLELFDDPPRPWVGGSLVEPAVLEGAVEARTLAMAGTDVVRVEVPVGRELVRRLGERGVEVSTWRSPRRAKAVDPADDAPSGSQRGLAVLRQVLDGAAAARHGYVRLMTAPPVLGGPEAAVVAALERVDLVEVDLAAEVVSGGVDPARAIADHDWSCRVHRRAGTSILLGAGPLAVAPELAAGVNSDVATRAGRALGLQLLGAACARAAGVPAGAIIVGGVPTWLIGEPDGPAQAVAEVALRRAILGDHPLALVEPQPAEGGSQWLYLVAAILPSAPAGRSSSAEHALAIAGSRRSRRGRPRPWRRVSPRVCRRGRCRASPPTTRGAPRERLARRSSASPSTAGIGSSVTPARPDGAASAATRSPRARADVTSWTISSADPVGEGRSRGPTPPGRRGRRARRRGACPRTSPHRRDPPASRRRRRPRDSARRRP